jgi:hypothetical protein
MTGALDRSNLLPAIAANYVFRDQVYVMLTNALNYDRD